MNGATFRIAFLVFAVGLGMLSAAPIAQALTPDELRRSIEHRSEELERVTRQIQDTQRQLTETETKEKSLGQELKRFEYRLNQLTLQIRSGEITRDKLLLELQGLELDVARNEAEAARKRQAIGRLLRELYAQEREHLLLTLLEHDTLAGGVFELQSYEAASADLSRQLRELAELKRAIERALAETEEKKRDVEAENRNLRNRKAIVDDQKQDRGNLLRLTKNQERLYQEQLKKLEDQQEEILAEIERIEKELRAQIQEPLLPFPRPGVLAWPTGNGTVISQGYGSTAFALRNYRGRYHNGVDIAGPIGTEIYAAERGAVIAVGNQDQFCPRGAYGKFIVVRHENGLTTLSAHLSRQTVAVGTRVERGELIGYMGRTGYATGSHLHFTVWSSDTYTTRATRVCGSMPVGGDIDPNRYLERRT